MFPGVWRLRPESNSHAVVWALQIYYSSLRVRDGARGQQKWAECVSWSTHWRRARRVTSGQLPEKASPDWALPRRRGAAFGAGRQAAPARRFGVE